MHLRNLKDYIKYYILVFILIIKLNILLNICGLTVRNDNVKVI